jgi:hypothetical protein
MQDQLEGALLIQLDMTGTMTCGYYFVHLQKRALCWLDSVDARDESFYAELLGVSEVWHLSMLLLGRKHRRSASR